MDIDSGEQKNATEKKRKGKTKAQERAERVIENKKVRVQAGYTTDKIFSQASVKRGFEGIESVKKILSTAREEIVKV